MTSLTASTPRHATTLLLVIFVPSSLLAQTDRADTRATTARNGMVVSVSAPASEAGLEILRKGGNAVDAAVATAFALAVTYPAAGNLGGGGFMVVHPGPGKEPKVIEYREAAPAAATRTMYGKADSMYGHKVVGVPGTVRGLELAHKRFGKLPWKDVVQPAIRLADQGFVIGESLANSLSWIVLAAKDFPELQRVYGKGTGGDSWEDGDLLVQKDLAAT